TGQQRVIGETLVAELRGLVRALRYRSAVWEWAIWEHGDRAYLPFLKITLSQSPARGRRVRLFASAGLSLFRATTALRQLHAFLDYCLSTRRSYETVNTIPFGEPGFKVGSHIVELFGNFISERPTLYGSVRAKNYWLLKADSPFWIAEYALHSSVGSG